MSVYFSTQASIEARITSLRLNGYIDIDGDGFPDEDTMDAGFSAARGLIRGYLERRYGSDEIDTWDSITAPELVKNISDDLCIHFFFTMSPNFRETGAILKQEAVDLLKQIAAGEISLYGVTAPVVDELVIDRTPSDFDPERELDDMTVRTTWTLPDARKLSGY